MARMKMMEYGAVIPAAGMSTRMKGFKQLMSIGNEGLLKRVIITLKRCGVNNIVVVTGYRSEEIIKSLKAMKLIFIHNGDYERTTMFDSLKLGMQYIENKCERFFVCPSDVPLFLPETVFKLMSCRGEVVIPYYKGLEGHPVLMNANLIPQIEIYKGEDGLRGAIRSLNIKAVRVAVNDPYCVIDADTQSDFQQLKKMYYASLAHPIVNVALAGETTFFDSQMVLLLNTIDSLKSVKGACDTIGISYSKAWHLINDTEKGLGYKIVDRKQGGKFGGHASLTSKGKKLLEDYQRYLKDVSDYAEKQFEYFFGKRMLIINNSDKDK